MNTLLKAALAMRGGPATREEAFRLVAEFRLAHPVIARIFRAHHFTTNAAMRAAEDKKDDRRRLAEINSLFRRRDPYELFARKAGWIPATDTHDALGRPWSHREKELRYRRRLKYEIWNADRDPGDEQPSQNREIFVQPAFGAPYRRRKP